MIHLTFFLKFKTQLNRIKPEIIIKTDELLNRLITETGGVITSNRSCLSAVFRKESIGFWLEIYFLTEKLKTVLERSGEYYGYSLVISANMSETPELLNRFLANRTGGIFFDAEVTEKFSPYAVFEKPSVWLMGRKSHKFGSEGYYRVKELKTFKQKESDNKSYKNINNLLQQEHSNKILILDNNYPETRKNIFEYCKKINGDFPPLKITFGSTGLGSLVDIWSDKIRLIFDENSAEEINSLHEFLFKQRLRDEVSDYVIWCLKRYLYLILDYYIAVSYKKKCQPVFILENIHFAGKIVTNIVLDLFSQLNESNRQKLLVFGCGDSQISSKKLVKWKNVFDSVIKSDNNESNEIIPDLTPDLWEIIYSVILFNRYFSHDLIKKLFEEENKKPEFISRVFDILYTLGIIYKQDEPIFLDKNIEDYAIKELGDNINSVKNIVIERLLYWAENQRISPCYRLLMIISSLGGSEKFDDILLLKTITSDIINYTTSGFEKAFNDGQTEDILSAEKSEVLKVIYRTSKGLYSGKENNINQAFQEINCDKYPELKIQFIVNECCRLLANRDIKKASVKAKEAIVLGQKYNDYCHPQVYRLFALINLSQKKVSEAIEYLNFSLTIAERNKNYFEMGVSAFYAAVSFYISGDIFSAQLNVKKSIKYSLIAGCAEWADRSSFLEGRLEFELGHYLEAFDIFSAIHDKPYGIKTSDKSSLLNAWIYRCLIFLPEKNISVPDSEHPDFQLFQIESAYVNGKYSKVIKLTGDKNYSDTSESFLVTERPLWQSGFSQCENIYYSNGEIYDRLKRMYISLSKAKLSEEGRKEALDDIEHLLRNENLCEMDPQDSIYYFIKYRLLAQKETDTVDMSTAINMSFRRLQRRISRIEDVETRNRYTSGSYWNNELTLVAKEYKLI